MGTNESSEVRRVLVQLGLEEYLGVFEENKIDDSCLESIEKDDLVGLIPAVGHRAVIWNALSKLKMGLVYVCFSCGKGFVRLKQLASHLTDYHKFTGNSEYRCTICEGLFNRKSFLQHHRNSFQVHKQFLTVQNVYEPPEIEIYPEPVNYNSKDTRETGRSHINLEDLENNIMKLLCSILKSGKVPISTGDLIISSVKNLIDTTIDFVVNSVNSIITNSLKKEDMLNQVSKIKGNFSFFSKIDSRYKLDKYLIERNLMVPPKQIVLDTDIQFTSSLAKGQVQKYKSIPLQYVPIKDSIIQLLKIPGFFEILELNKSFNGEVYSNFREGSFFRTSAFPSNTLFINIYYDDAEIANPLGSKSGKHKLANFYFSILDLPQHMLSSIDNIQLLATLKTIDLKSSSVNSVMQIIVQELKELWVEGITFEHQGKTENLKIALAQIIGDNLGLHTILGFTEGFSANYPCRRCKLPKNQCKITVQESRENLRNINNYKADVLLSDFPKTGINFESILNELPYLHVTNIYVFDIMHDILEGVAPDLLVIMINLYIQKRYFYLDQLNHRIESFDYGRGYRTTKPSQIKSSSLKGEIKFAQNASQTLCLMLHLPLMIGDLIPYEDEVWDLFLMCREILLIVLADNISKGGTVYLDAIISEYLTTYQEMFKKTLKPKHHHLTHYASSIEQIGPLRHFWSMTFESKHKFFKTAAHAACNFKNVTKTLAYRHQLSLCFKLHSKQLYTPMNVDYDDKLCDKIEDESDKKVLVDRFGESCLNSLRVSSRVTCNGCDFEIGSLVVVKYCSQYPVFGLVKMIVTLDEECNLLVDLLNGEHVSHFSCFKLTDVTETKVIDIHEINHYQPVSRIRSLAYNDTNLYAVLAFKRETQSDGISIFEASIISEQELRDRGLSLSRDVIKKFKKPDLGSTNSNEVVKPQEYGRPTLVLNNDLNVQQAALNEDFEVISNCQSEVIPLVNQGEPLFVEPAQSPPALIRSETTPKPNPVSAYHVSEVVSPLHSVDFGKNIYGFNIADVLLSTLSTRTIITKKITENRFILRADRQAVAAVLIDAVIEKLGTSPSKSALEQLAQHLVIRYPSLGDRRREEFGWQMWFFHTMRGQGATGFLEDRLKNQRKRLLKNNSTQNLLLHVAVEQIDWTSEEEDDNPVPVESELEYLKHNVGIDVPSRMKATVFMRRSLLRVYRDEKLIGLQKAMMKMPRLFDTENMIIQDFNVRHPKVAMVLYERWPRVSKLLLEYAEESEISYKKKLDIAKHRYDLTDGDICLIAFCLLPFILPSCGRKMTADSDSEDEENGSSSSKRSKQGKKNRKRQCSVKASDIESLRSMIVFRSRNTHVSDVLQENKRMAPFILALGSSADLDFSSYFVIVSKLAIPCGSSFIVALDTCFKCFTVLYWPLPIESYDHWLFIQHGVFGKPYLETEVPPVVQALIGQIMCRM